MRIRHSFGNSFFFVFVLLVFIHEEHPLYVGREWGGHANATIQCHCIELVSFVLCAIFLLLMAHHFRSEFFIISKHLSGLFTFLMCLRIPFWRLLDIHSANPTLEQSGRDGEKNTHIHTPNWHATTRKTKTKTNKRFVCILKWSLLWHEFLRFFFFGGLLFFCTQLNKLLESDLYDICHFGAVLLLPPQPNTSSCGFRIILLLFFFSFVVVFVVVCLLFISCVHFKRWAGATVARASIKLFHFWICSPCVMKYCKQFIWWFVSTL